MMTSDAKQDIQDFVSEIVDGVRAFSPIAGARFPRYDLVETEEAYLALFDLPGLSREQIDIRTETDEVIVSGQREQAGGDGSRRRVERPFGEFSRRVRVPADVDLDSIRAGLADGVLTVTLPRRADQPARKVDIEQ